jgi:hypothetical protein
LATCNTKNFALDKEDFYALDNEGFFNLTVQQILADGMKNESTLVIGTHLIKKYTH